MPDAAAGFLELALAQRGKPYGWGGEVKIGMPGALVATRGLFNEAQHPRAWHGRFAALRSGAYSNDAKGAIDKAAEHHDAGDHAAAAAALLEAATHEHGSMKGTVAERLARGSARQMRKTAEEYAAADHPKRRWWERKDISTMSGGTFTVPALGAAAVQRPGMIATPVENALKGMAKLHNAVHGSTAGSRADVAALRAVYRRGTRAYDPKRHAGSSRRRWGMRRVKAHLQMLASGKRPHPRYKGDDDLLPAGHPLAASTSGERKALLAVEGPPAVADAALPVPVARVAAMLEGKSASLAFAVLEVKGLWNPDKHPRDHHGRFIHIGAAINAMIDGKQQNGTVIAVGGGKVRVRTADGAEHAVKAGDATVTDHVGGHLSVLEHAAAHTDASRKADQLAKAGHPEAAAWAQRRDALGGKLKDRVQAGESVRDPYVPPASMFADERDLATAEGLHRHLTSGAHGKAKVPEFGQDEHAAYAQMHDRAHELGADHTHEPDTGPTSSPEAYAEHLNGLDPEGQWEPRPNPRHGGVDVVSGSRGNVGRTFDASGRDTGGALGTLGGRKPGAGGPGNSPTRPDGTAWGTGYAPGDPRANPDYDRYVANVDAKNDAAITAVGDTQQVHDHVDGIVGAYQPARQAMHDEIVDELMAKYASVPRERKAVMLAGPSGAGKSTTIRLLGHQFGVESKEETGPDGKPTTVPTNYATVNPDDIKEIMVARGMVDPALYGQFGLGPQEGMTLIHEESSDIAKALNDHLASHGTNILVDGTFSGKLDKNVGKIQKLRSSGYTVTGVLVDGDISKSLENAGKRHTKIKTGVAGAKIDLDTPMQGRYVPLGHIEAQRPAGIYSDLLDRPHRSQNAENFEGAKEAFNGGIRIYDNSSGAAKLVYSDEVEPGGAPKVEGLSGRHLDLIKSGSIGRRADTGDMPSMIAHALLSAGSNDRPQYLNPGYQGWQTANAPVGNEYVEVLPSGIVTRVKTDVTSGEVTRDVMPQSDVARVVDHYLKPDRAAKRRAKVEAELAAQRVSPRDAQAAVEAIGDERADEILGPGGLSGATDRQLRRLVAEAGGGDAGARG